MGGGGLEVVVSRRTGRGVTEDVGAMIFPS